MSVEREDEGETCLGEFYGISHAAILRMYNYFTAPETANGRSGVSEQTCNLV